MNEDLKDAKELLKYVAKHYEKKDFSDAALIVQMAQTKALIAIGNELSEINWRETARELFTPIKPINHKE